MSQPKQGTAFGATVAVIALFIQIGGLLWIGGKRTQQIDNLLAMATEFQKQETTHNIHVQELQTEIVVLQQQVMTLQNMLRELQARLEAKKIVGELTPADPITKAATATVRTL